MQLKAKNAITVKHAISVWREQGLLKGEDADRLDKSIKIMPFDWKRLAKYSFGFSMVCMVIAISSLIADEYFIKMIIAIFKSSNVGKLTVFSILSILFYYMGYIREVKKPGMVYSIESLFLAGVIFTAAAVYQVGIIFDNGSGSVHNLLMLSAGIYAALGLLLRSQLIWLFFILSLGSWYGTSTGYTSGWGAYYLGMNYPMRFVAFGIALAFLSHLFLCSKKFKEFFHPTFVMSLLYTFIALWILSIFGNNTEYKLWSEVKQIELLHWSVLFACASFGAIYYGLRYDNSAARGFGIMFLFINLYTRFFEYFWDITHKSIFFAILGLSLWLVGSKAEKIWGAGKKSA